MNSVRYYDYIEEHLNVLSVRINTKGKLNQLELHGHSEYFYQRFCNKLYPWNLKNVNQERQNVEAIDLIDDDRKFVVQVSATATKDKIESSLNKKIIKDHSGYTFKFIAISKDADSLRRMTYLNPYGIKFNPSADIIDCKSILKYLMSLDAVKQRDIRDFIKDELGREVDVVKLDSNLTTIINILSEEDWDNTSNPLQINAFEIDRKISFNKLTAAKCIIDDYSVHYARVNKKYAEFDKQGANKSSSVLATIRKEYLKNLKIKSDDELFFLVTEGIKQQIVGSPNFVKISVDELELCINILVVDAFIRCKIFKNPEQYKYVNS